MTNIHPGETPGMVLERIRQEVGACAIKRPEAPCGWDGDLWHGVRKPVCSPGNKIRVTTERLNFNPRGIKIGLVEAEGAHQEKDRALAMGDRFWDCMEARMQRLEDGVISLRAERLEGTAELRK